MTEAGHTSQEEFLRLLVKVPLRKRKQGTYGWLCFVVSIKPSLKNSLENSFPKLESCSSEKKKKTFKNQPKNAAQGDADACTGLVRPACKPRTSLATKMGQQTGLEINQRMR